MKEIPSPTLPLVGLLDFGAGHHKAVASRRPRSVASYRNAGAQSFEVVWATHLDDVREAQRLRYDVFANEMGARLQNVPGAPEHHDIDTFDDYCEHLLVRTLATDDQASTVIGTYRVLTPGAARRAGGYYSDTEFDLTGLRRLRPQMAELGRSCVHPEHRSGGVILALWGALAGFMHDNGLDTMVGCASIGMRDGGHLAASLWSILRETHLAPAETRAFPRVALPISELDHSKTVEPPALIKGYLRCGAKVLGAPAWDPDFNTADLPMLMRLDDLPDRYRKHFLHGH
jgi:putative hemolysin